MIAKVTQPRTKKTLATKQSKNFAERFLSPLGLFRKHHCQSCLNKQGNPCKDEVKCILITLATAMNDLPTGFANELWELETQKRCLQ